MEGWAIASGGGHEVRAMSATSRSASTRFIGNIFVSNVVLNAIELKPNGTPKCQVSDSWNADFVVEIGAVINLNKIRKRLQVKLYKHGCDRRDGKERLI